MQFFAAYNAKGILLWLFWRLFEDSFLQSARFPLRGICHENNFQTCSELPPGETDFSCDVLERVVY